MPSRLLFWLALAWLCVTAFVAAPGHASGAVVGQPVTVCVAPATRAVDAQAVLRGDSGLRFDCTKDQTALGSGDFWVVSRSMPADVKTNMPLGVRFASLWQQSLTLHALYPDGSVVTRRMDDSAASRRIQLGTIFQLRLPERAHAPVRLAWHIEGAANMRGVLAAPRIATPGEGSTANLVMAALYAGFAGLVGAVLIHNLALWRALRQRFQLWYMAMLTGLLIYAFSSSGALAWVWPDIHNTDRLRFSYVMLAATGIASLRFARNFFEERVFVGWIGQLANALMVLLIGSTAATVVAPNEWMRLVDQVYNAALLALVGFTMPVVWRAWREKSRYVWPFVLAWTAPYLLCGMRTIHNLGQFEWGIWIENSTLFAMALEALAGSLAIAYRVRLLAEERDEARAEELAARMLADVDPLTGLLNRRAFLSRAIGRPGEQMLLIIDLDRFKTVNDTIGHDGGDEVLRRVARVLRELCPADGLATRFGGEEFALLCNAASPVAADDVLARLRETRMPYDLTVTASIGGCSGPLESERDWKLLYRAADRALFMAKDAGRDRARAAGGAALVA